MRTKALLCAAAFAAGIVSTMAQSNVYSLNVVGYVNVVIPGDSAYSCIANPLNNANNNITNLFPASGMVDGATILKWDPTISDFQAMSPTFSTFLSAWVGDFNANPGEGIFFVNPAAAPITNTFVGEVIQGSFTNSLLGNSSYNLVASSAPLGGSFTNAIDGVVAEDGDTVAVWDVAIQDLGAVSPSYSSFLGQWVGDLNIGVGSGFFYIRAGADTAWVRNFTVK